LLNSSAHASAVVVHAQDAYDYSLKTKAGIEKALQSIPVNERYFLQNENGNWILETEGRFQYSRYGEHHLSGLGKEITLMGSQLGACLQYAFLDILNFTNEAELTITVPTNSVSDISGDTIRSFDAAEAKRLFSRFPEYLKRKHVRITIQKNGIPVDSFSLNGHREKLRVVLNFI